MADQRYRDVLAEAFATWSQVTLVDQHRQQPHRLNLAWPDKAAMFRRYVDVAGQVDLLIAYLPEASMGSAMEMWSAYTAGVPILAVSPLRSNWALAATASLILDDLDSFRSFLRACEPDTHLLLKRVRGGAA